MRRRGMGVHIARFLRAHGVKILLGLALLPAMRLLSRWGIINLHTVWPSLDTVLSHPSVGWWFVNTEIRTLAPMAALFLMWCALWLHERPAAWVMGTGLSTLLGELLIRDLDNRGMAVVAPDYDVITLALLVGAILFWMSWQAESMVRTVGTIMEEINSDATRRKLQRVVGWLAAALVVLATGDAMLNVLEAGYGWPEIRLLSVRSLLTAFYCMNVGKVFLAAGTWASLRRSASQREWILRLSFALFMGQCLACLLVRSPVALEIKSVPREGVVIGLVFSAILYGMRHVGTALMWASELGRWIGKPLGWPEQEPFCAEFRRGLYDEILEEMHANREAEGVGGAKATPGRKAGDEERGMPVDGARDKSVTGAGDMAPKTDSWGGAGDADWDADDDGTGSREVVEEPKLKKQIPPSGPKDGEMETVRGGPPLMGPAHPRIFTRKISGRGKEATSQALSALHAIYGMEVIRKAVGCGLNTPPEEVKKRVAAFGCVVEKCYDENGGSFHPTDRMIRLNQVGKLPGARRDDPLGPHEVGSGRVFSRMYDAVLDEGAVIEVAERNQYEGVAVRPDMLMRITHESDTYNDFIEYETGKQKDRELKEKLEKYIRNEDKPNTRLIFVCEAPWKHRIENIMKALPRPRYLKVLYLSAAQVKKRRARPEEILTCAWLMGETAGINLLTGPVRGKNAENAGEKTVAPSAPSVDEWTDDFIEPSKPAYNFPRSPAIRAPVLTGEL